MTARFTRLVAYSSLFLALGLGVSVASSGAPNSTAIRPATSALCIRTSSHNRIALHCQCCGWDENKHCNHQCCN
jgi:hypothetical protein